MGNIGLTVALIFLFVVPLYSVIESTKQVNSTVSHQISRVVRRNLYFGLIMLISTSLNVIADTIAWSLMGSVVDLDYLGVVVYLFTALDSFTLTFCARLMTNIWLPISWRGYLKSSESSSPVSTPHHGSSKRIANENHRSAARTGEIIPAM